MGSGASTVGVPTNPRVQYSHKLERKEQKKVLVDAPVLVDVEHGSVRYRQPGMAKDIKGKEKPYETETIKELSNKEHYFYHARLKKYGPDMSKENEDPFKLYYVLKGPVSAQKKKVFYVYGQGWGARDGLKVKPTETVGQGNDYAWSSSRQPNSLYYRLEFDKDAKENAPETEEDQIVSDMESTPDKSNISLQLSRTERVRDLKARLAIRLLKSTKDIHIAYDNKELRDEDVIKDFQFEEETVKETAEENTVTEPPTTCAVLLKLIM